LYLSVSVISLYLIYSVWLSPHWNN
jgi:hypothetical protein